MESGKRILIVGGVAGGASCAARARRLSEDAQIILFERGPFVSFANCGLPYFVGDVIKKEEALLVATPDLFRKRFNIEIRLYSEVTSIDREQNEVEIEDLRPRKRYREKYDALVLSPGASSISPPVPGVDLPGIFTVRSIPDSRQIKEWIKKFVAKRAMVIGGGFIGLEMTENLAKLGLPDITIIEMQPQVRPLSRTPRSSRRFRRNSGVTVFLFVLERLSPPSKQCRTAPFPLSSNQETVRAPI